LEFVEEWAAREEAEHAIDILENLAEDDEEGNE
jgi:hypothetical protein